MEMTFSHMLFGYFERGNFEKLPGRGAGGVKRGEGEIEMTTRNTSQFDERIPVYRNLAHLQSDFEDACEKLLPDVQFTFLLLASL